MTLDARPLAGRIVVVTRPEHQAAALAARIEEAGGRALRFPVIAIEPATSPELDSIIDALDSFDLAIFISRNAVAQGLDRIQARRKWPPGIATAAIGGGTRQALEERGFEQTLSPDGLADTEALLHHPGLAELAGKRVVIFRGEGGREALADGLRAHGASVVYAECYRRRMPSLDPGPLLANLGSGTVDAIVVTSGEGLANLVSMLGGGAAELLAGTRLFVPHARLTDTARSLGVSDPVVAGPADEDMLSALVAYFGRAG